MNHFAAALSEEQERELSPEIKREREGQRVAPEKPEKPASHALHPDMVTYIATGRTAADSPARVSAFNYECLAVPRSRHLSASCVCVAGLCAYS